MRLRSLLMVLGASLLVLLTGGPSSLAENDTLLTRDPTLQRGRGFVMPFSRLRPHHVMPLRQQAAPASTRRVAPVVVRDDPVIPKVDLAHHVVVLGDSLGDLVVGGLDEALNDRPDVAVLRKTRLESGLVRSDFYDWSKAVTELLASEQKITAAVMLLGLNDRQAIREGEIVHEPFSPRWLELYRDRIDNIAAAFSAKRIPLLWVGLPPVQNARLSADYVVLNDLYRQRVERAGGQYVDLWGGFVDSENRYAATGPDVSGQPTRLRTADGIHFTKAGARKAAHFIDVVIRRMIEGGPQGLIAVSTPSGASQDGAESVERTIDRMVGNSWELSALSPGLQAKPLAGPIQPLTGPASAGERALLASIQEARGRGDVANQLERVFGEGVASETKPGRIDDYRWPRRN